MTVGMHTAGFDRMIDLADTVAKTVDDRWVAQIGASRRVPTSMEWFRFCNHDEFSRYLNQAACIITHGGYTVVEALQRGKRVIGVPRHRNLREAIDDHQVDFLEWLEFRGLARCAHDVGGLATALRATPLLDQTASSGLAERRLKLMSYLDQAIKYYSRKSQD